MKGYVNLIYRKGMLLENTLLLLLLEMNPRYSEILKEKKLFMNFI